MREVNSGAGGSRPRRWTGLRIRKPRFPMATGNGAADVEPQVQAQLTSPWFRYLLTYGPFPALRKLDPARWCPQWREGHAGAAKSKLGGDPPGPHRRWQCRLRHCRATKPQSSLPDGSDRLAQRVRLHRGDDVADRLGGDHGLDCESVWCGETVAQRCSHARHRAEDARSVTPEFIEIAGAGCE